MTDTAKVTQIYEETKAKVSLLNKKLDQRRGKNIQANILNQNLPNRQVRRRRNQSGKNVPGQQESNRRLSNPPVNSNRQYTQNNNNLIPNYGSARDFRTEYTYPHPVPPSYSNNIQPWTI